MKVSCPSCSATLNIDDKKIPPGGARIKCPTCAHVFPVRPGGSDAVALPGASSPSRAAVPLPGVAAAKVARQEWEEEPTRAVPLPGIPGALTAAAPPSNVGVPLPGQSSPSRLGPARSVANEHEESTSVGKLPTAASYGGTISSVALPGAAPPPLASAPKAVALPGPSRSAATASTPSGSVPLPGAHRADPSGGFDVGRAASSPSGSIPLPGGRGASPSGSVPLPGGRPPAAPNRGVPLPGGHDFSEAPLPEPTQGEGFDFTEAPPEPTQGEGFDFAEAPPEPTQGEGFDFAEAPAPEMGGGFDFSEAPAPSAQAGGFDFPEPPPPKAATAGGFDFVDTQTASGSAPQTFDFGDLPAPTSAAPIDDLAFDFNAPPPTSAPSFGEVDLGGPPPATGGHDELEFDPMGGAQGGGLEADLTQSMPAPTGPNGPTDGLEMLSFIDETAHEAGVQAEGTGTPVRRFHIKRRSGKVFGPFEEAVIVKMMEDGQLLGNEEVSLDTENWQPIGAEPAFQAVIARLMASPARAETQQVLPQVGEQAKGPSMERLKQLYEGRMAAVAVVQGKEPVSFKMRLPLLVAGSLLLAFIGVGVFAAVATPYGPFFIKKLFPSRVKSDSREYGYLQEARKGLARDTYTSYLAAREQANGALKINEYPEARAVWNQAVYALRRKYGVSYAKDADLADASLDKIALLGEKHPDVLKAKAGQALVQKNSAAAIGFIDDALAREDEPELHFLRAEALMQQKQLAQAKAELDQVVKVDSKSARAFHLLGVIALAQKDFDTATAKFQHALVADPLHVSSAVELAELEMVARKNAEKAAQYLEQALADEARKQLAPAELGKALGLKAELLVLSDNLAESVPQFEEAIEADPTNAFAKAGLGQTYVKLHQVEKAVPLFAAAYEAMPDRLEYAENYLGALIAIGKMDDAVKVVQAATQRFPGNAMLAYLSGRVSDAIDKPKDAEDAYKRAIAADPNITDAYLYLARLFIRFRRFGEARPVLESGLEKDANNAALRVGMGELAFHGRDVERAEAEFKKASELDPHSAEAFLGLSRVALEREQFDVAAGQVEKALELNPRVSGGRMQKGVTLWKLGRLDEAITELNQARADEPRNVNLVVTLGAVEFEKGELTDALSHLSSAMHADTVPPDAYFYFARVKNAKLEHTQAIDNMKRAIDSDSKNPTYHYWMGRIFFDATRTDDAIGEWRLALDLDPRYADALEAMGRVYYEQNKLTQSIAYFNKVLAVEPNRNTVRAAIADAQMKVDDWAGAIANYTRAIEGEPNNKDLLYVHFRLAQAYQEKGQFKDAITWYKKTIEVDPTNPDTYRALGYLYKDTHKPKLAIEAFRKYLEIRPNGEDKKQIDDEIYDLSKER